LWGEAGAKKGRKRVGAVLDWPWKKKKKRDRGILGIPEKVVDTAIKRKRGVVHRERKERPGVLHPSESRFEGRRRRVRVLRRPRAMKKDLGGLLIRGKFPKGKREGKKKLFLSRVPTKKKKKKKGNSRGGGARRSQEEKGKKKRALIRGSAQQKGACLYSPKTLSKEGKRRGPITLFCRG